MALGLLQAQPVDFTRCFRALTSSVLGDAGPGRSLFAEPSFGAYRTFCAT
jgi:hypothetical protein